MKLKIFTIIFLYKKTYFSNSDILALIILLTIKNTRDFVQALS